MVTAKVKPSQQNALNATSIDAAKVAPHRGLPMGRDAYDSGDWYRWFCAGAAAACLPWASIRVGDPNPMYAETGPDRVTPRTYSGVVSDKAYLS